jgi:branched-chain amino acid transport system substrate-binding protein
MLNRHSLQTGMTCTNTKEKTMKIANKLGRAIAIATLGVGMSATATADEIVIGFTGPLSGGAALYGENTLSGLRMAAAEINEAGGFEVGGEMHTIDVKALDDRYSPSQAATNAKRLKDEDNAPVIFTPHSGGIFALQDFNEEAGFLIGAYSSVPSITEKGNKLTLRIPPTFDGYVKAFSEYLIDEAGPKMGMGGATHEYAKIWASMVEKEWTEQGGEIVEKNAMDYNKSADFYTGVSRLVASNPDVMFIGGASEPTALVAQQARQLGFEGSFMVMDQAKLDEMADVIGGYELLEGAVGVTPLAEYGTDAADTFMERYEERYDKRAGSEAAYNYLALHGVVEAMERSDSLDPTEIRAHIEDALANMDASKNPYGVSQVDAGGGFMTDLTIGVVEDGKVKRISLD